MDKPQTSFPPGFGGIVLGQQLELEAKQASCIACAQVGQANEMILHNFTRVHATSAQRKAISQGAAE